MKRVKIDGYLFGRMKRRIAEEALNEVGYSLKHGELCYTLAWGKPKYKPAGGLIESGFFWDAVHIDTCGLYQHSVLNNSLAKKQILSFRPPKTAKEIVFSPGVPNSKYRQRRERAEWSGVVLALQRPKDRSIKVVGTPEDYYDFVEGACKKWGKDLFLKEHPSGSSEHDRWVEMAKEHGCTIGKVNHNVIKNCKFCIVYNSGFAIDCMLRDVPVMQFAPGYFQRTGAVTYTDRKYLDEVEDTIEMGHKLTDFVIWKYCINKQMPVDMWAKMIAYFAESNNSELFPLPEEFSYASNKQWSIKK